MSEKAFVKPYDTYQFEDNVFVKSGPRLHIAFKPEDVKVGIVTCGGICPGKHPINQRIKRRYQRNSDVFMV